jgi:hypothetical protein
MYNSTPVGVRAALGVRRVVILRFSDGERWAKATRVFGKVREVLDENYPEDDELRHKMEMIEVFGGGGVADLDPALARRLMIALKTITDKIVTGGVSACGDTYGIDPRGYIAAVEELRDRVERELSRRA